MHTYMYVHATFPFIRLARGKLRLALQKNHRRRKQIVSGEVGAGRLIWKLEKQQKSTRTITSNIGRCVLSDFLMKKVTRFPIINLRRNWFGPCEFLCWNRSICQRRNLRGFFSLSSISIVFLWQVHVCVCQISSKCLRNETVYDIVTSYERLRVHLHLHKLFQCSRFQRYPASYWCNNSHTYSKHQKVTNAQSQSPHVSGLFMSVLIVFRFQFHLSGQKRNSTHKIDREKVMKID